MFFTKMILSVMSALSMIGALATPLPPAIASLATATFGIIMCNDASPSLPPPSLNPSAADWPPPAESLQKRKSTAGTNVVEAPKYVVANCKDAPKWTSGQVFMKDGWNVIVAKQDCSSDPMGTPQSNMNDPRKL
ncbi:hypothetical protein B0T14DRAFT_492503 [Immersiella caudata]|uniref:Uncharacterized protein n=1 Tax=Immersiella caudata TaxID=314043 RepID=A0AA40C5V0_9PEZI|nr:hypothetical protein B0T14DRAFT_492503 [Immersiella caudata]